jgi:hypothetical protein
MPMNAEVAGTPYYVLMDGKRRIGPSVVKLPSGVDCLPIYGFSDKGPYEQFRLNSQQALTPYPLVKFYLKNQADESGGELKLVVVDAAGPREPTLRAATMQAVLEAQEKGTTHVAARYQLMFDQEASAYRVEEAPV